MARHILLLALLLGWAVVGCMGCDSSSPEMKECLGTCADAEAKSQECTGPAAEECKKAISEAANECRELCKEHVK